MNKQEIEKAIEMMKEREAVKVNKQEAIQAIKSNYPPSNYTMLREALDLAISALEKQIPKIVYHFLEDDTFETTCCGIDVTNQDFQDFQYCPYCGQRLGDVKEVEVEDE